MKWLGQQLLNEDLARARADEINALLARNLLDSRADSRVLHSCCAVLSSSYSNSRQVRRQAERLLIHYRAWCDSLGIPRAEHDEGTAMGAMLLWADYCMSDQPP